MRTSTKLKCSDDFESYRIRIKKASGVILGPDPFYFITWLVSDDKRAKFWRKKICEGVS